MIKTAKKLTMMLLIGATLFACQPKQQAEEPKKTETSESNVKETEKKPKEVVNEVPTIEWDENGMAKEDIVIKDLPAIPTTMEDLFPGFEQREKVEGEELDIARQTRGNDDLVLENSENYLFFSLNDKFENIYLKSEEARTGDKELDIVAMLQRLKGANLFAEDDVVVFLAHQKEAHVYYVTTSTQQAIDEEIVNRFNIRNITIDESGQILMYENTSDIEVKDLPEQRPIEEVKDEFNKLWLEMDPSHQELGPDDYMYLVDTVDNYEMTDEQIKVHPKNPYMVLFSAIVGDNFIAYDPINKAILEKKPMSEQ